MSMTDTDGNVLAALFAKLSVSIDNLTDAHTRNEQRLRREAEAKRAEQPSYNRIYGTGIVPASGFLVVDMGGPTQGYLWHVRNLAVGGLTPVTVASGRADVYVFASGGGMVNAQSLDAFGLSEWRDQSAALPNVATYGEGELFIHSMERLYVVFSTATVGQQLAVGGTVQNVQDAANLQATAY